ncbi:hypothetical protein TNCT_352921 [Trichonephila clavata]|uniref:Uncharacterized protein n=1 Tax=Trichonephila clavata TaxID=2740835 RepID=A0A8X6GA33_TRICU|nr:hypothetical protein TNCT_352921 [Trichonephila clavata]
MRQLWVLTSSWSEKGTSSVHKMLKTQEASSSILERAHLANVSLSSVSTKEDYSFTFLLDDSHSLVMDDPTVEKLLSDMQTPAESSVMDINKSALQPLNLGI